MSIEKISLLIASISLLLAIGLPSWTFTIMKTRIEFLKEDIEKLKASENRWMTRYRKVVQLILDNKECAPGVPCKTKEKYLSMMDEDGVL